MKKYIKVRLNQTTTHIIIPGRTKRELAEESITLKENKPCTQTQMPTKTRT